MHLKAWWEMLLMGIEPNGKPRWHTGADFFHELPIWFRYQSKLKKPVLLARTKSSTYVDLSK